MSRLSNLIRTLVMRVPHRSVPSASTRKPPLVLHIGPHKTGTTAIQMFCERNRKLLAKAGIWYPAVGAVSGQHMILPGCYLSHHSHIPKSLLGGCPEDIVAAIAAEVPRGLMPLMSSEVYWELLCNQPEAFESAVGVLASRYHVHIVMTERPVVERVWSAMKFKSRLGFAFDPAVEFVRLRDVDGRVQERLVNVGYPVIRVAYDDDDCISPFLRSLSSPLVQRQSVRPRELDALVERCRVASPQLRENAAPTEPWFVAFTFELSRRLLAVKESSSHYHSRIAVFLRDAKAIGRTLESIRLLPAEETVRSRIVEASRSRAVLRTPMEVQAWESICGHPAVQQVALRTGCADELRAVRQPRGHYRRAA